MAAFKSSVQTAIDIKNAAAAVAAKQYVTDLNTALDAAMTSKKLDEANRDKAEIERIGSGAKIQDGTISSGTSVQTARKKYAISIQKAEDELIRTTKSAKHVCLVQLDAALALAEKGKDLDEANRIKAMRAEVNNPERSVAFLPRTINLLLLADPARDAITGDWQMIDRALVAQPGNGSQYNFPYEPPAEYDYIIEFTRWNSEWGTAFIFSHTDTGMFYGTGGSKGGGGGHFGAPETELPWGTDHIESAHRYTLRIEVRNDHLRAFTNDKLEVDLPTNYSNFGDLPGWIRPTKRIALIDFWSSMQYHKVEIVERSGPGIYFPPKGTSTHDLPVKSVK